MTIVLMDTRRHKTFMLEYAGPTVCQAVMWPNGRMVDAEFSFQGDFLRGDPIYLQTRGPEIPARWWDR